MIQIERIVVVVLLDKRAAPRLGTALFTLQAEDPKFEANLFDRFVFRYENVT